VGNAHNDVMMTCFMVAAIYALGAKRGKWSGGPLLALSALAKLFSGVLAPLFLVETIMRRWSKRALAIAAASTIAVVIVTAAPFWDGGDLWGGFREGTRLSQRMDHVSLLSLAQQHLKQERVESSIAGWRFVPYASADVVPQDQQDRLHQQFTVAFVVLALCVVAARLRRIISLERAAALTMVLFTLLMTNFYPWYLIPIFALLALDLDALGLSYMLAATALGLAYYPAYVWAHFNTEMPLYNVHLYLAIFLTAPMLAFLALDMWRIVRIAISENGRPAPADRPHPR
jgi:hypothetical protein